MSDGVTILAGASEQPPATGGESTASVNQNPETQPAPAPGDAKGVRYGPDVRRRAVELAAQGTPLAEIARQLGIKRAKSIGKWIAEARAQLAAPVGIDEGAERRAEQALERAGILPAPAAPAAAKQEAAKEPDPLAEPLALDKDEVAALADYLVRVGDAAGKRLIWRRWDLPIEGMDDGQRQLVRVFAKRISRAIDKVTDGEASNPVEFLCVFAGFLALPRAFRCLMSRAPAAAVPADGATPAGTRGT